MIECKEELLQLANEFKGCQKLLIALGDETRQHIIISLLECDCMGARVGEITKKTNLSRPAVSHHIKILKEAGIVGMRREGTKNYYYLDSEKTEWDKLNLMLLHVNKIIDQAPDRRAEIDE
jgi:ArsR family transcriptional regulator